MVCKTISNIKSDAASLFSDFPKSSTEAFVGFIKALQYLQTVVQTKLLTKLKVGIARTNVVEGAHESLDNQSYSHGIVDTKELR